MNTHLSREQALKVRVVQVRADKMPPRDTACIPTVRHGCTPFPPIIGVTVHNQALASEDHMRSFSDTP
jgi:hypothetical protein